MSYSIINRMLSEDVYTACFQAAGIQVVFFAALDTGFTANSIMNLINGSH